jgi:hypothetical protein
VLQKNGLVLYGPWCVLADEAKVFDLGGQAQRSHMEWQVAMMEREALFNADQVIPQLEGWIRQYDLEIQGVNRVMSRGHRHAGHIHAGVHPLHGYKKALEAQVGEAKRVLGNLRKKVFDPAAGLKIEERIGVNWQNYERKFTEFQRLVDATRRKYVELSRNQEVRNALRRLSRRDEIEYLLTASDDFIQVVESVEAARNNNGGDN